jgi:bacterioferritin
MAQQPSSSPSKGSSAPVTRDQLVEGLQQDLAREYKAIIQYVIFSQKLDTARFQNIAGELEKHAHEELDHALAIARQIDYYGAYPTHTPAAVEVSEDNEAMLWSDLRAEDDTIDNYRQRIRQADDLGVFALAVVLQELIKQEQDHQIDLASALGVVPDPRQRAKEGQKKKK